MEAVERLRAGRTLVSDGRAKSLDNALRALAGGATPPPESLARPDTAEEALRLLGSFGGDLAAIRERLEEIPLLREEVEALRGELGQQRIPAAIPSTLRPVAFGGGPAAETTPEAPKEARADSGNADGGVLVRLARWLERIRIRGRL
jgi:hypothetical protein